MTQLNEAIEQKATLEDERTRWWRARAFNPGLASFGLYTLYRSRGFAARSVVRILSHAIELYTIAMFADTDLFYSASRVTGLFFIALFFSYIGILHYRNTLIFRTDASAKKIQAWGLVCSLPFIVYALQAHLPYFQTLGLNFLAFYAVLRLVELAFDWFITYKVAALQAQFRIFFPNWINAVYVILAGTLATFALQFNLSVFLFASGFFGLRVIHQMTFLWMCKKTEAQIPPLSLLPMHTWERDRSKVLAPNFLASATAALSPYFIPILITLMGWATVSQAFFIWMSQVVVGSLVIRPMRSVMVDVVQCMQKKHPYATQTLVSQSTRATVVLAGIASALLLTAGLGLEFSLPMVAWCVVSIHSKAVVYRAFLTGVVKSIQLPILVTKIALPLLLIMQGASLQNQAWYFCIGLEVAFCVYASWRLFRSQKGTGKANKGELILVGLSASARAKKPQIRLLRTLGCVHSVSFLSRRYALVYPGPQGFDEFYNHCHLHGANWVTSCSKLGEEAQILDHIGWGYSAAVYQKVNILKKCNRADMPAFLSKHLSNELKSFGAVEVWSTPIEPVQAVTRKLGVLKIGRKEQMIRILDLVYTEPYLTRVQFQLLSDPEAGWYVVRNFEGPLVVIRTKARDKNVAKMASEWTQALLIDQLALAYTKRDVSTDEHTDQAA